MKTAVLASLVALAAEQVAAHSTFQQLWVDGVDFGSQCIRMPPNNNPVTNYGGNDIRCNVGGTRGVSGKCGVKAGGTVTVEMHAQPGDRNCKNEAIGGQHYGPITVYLSKVDNAATSDASGTFFKIYESGWSSKGASRGDDDNWAVKDMNTCCGRVDVKIPANIPNGDYLLRAEVLALHTAGQANGAQAYPACYQITVTGGTGTAIPSPNTKFPGAYKATDPGVKFDIHSKISSYVIPGPAVVSGGTTKVAGSGCTGQCEKSCTPGKGATGTVITDPSSGGSPDGGNPDGGSNSGCSLSAYEQCGGNTYTGCTTCGGSLACKAVSPPYYSQCQ